MLKIEFDPENTRLALAIGKALTEYAGGESTVRPIKSLPAEAVAPYGGEADSEVTGAPEPGAGEQFDKDVTKDVGKSADVAGQDTTAVQTGTQSDGAGSATTSKPTHDERGVMFIPAICGQANDPFYSTGPNKGQWKKRKGVDPAEYDRVYGEALTALGGTSTGTQESTASTVGRGVAKALEAQTNVGQDVANSSAAQTFGNQQQASAEETFGGQQQHDPLTETVLENPATPAEVFELYSQICQQGGAGVANKICEAAGIQNGTLIFANPHLAPKLFTELTAQKAALVGG